MDVALLKKKPVINYYLLTKPGIIMGNLITVAAGFVLASRGSYNFGLFAATLIGLALIIASACVFNNYIDRQTDQKMERTKNRALARGLISGKRALVFGTLLGILGNVVLYLFTNPLALGVADFGFIVYVFFYSIWKSRTIYGTAIGSIAGGVPPIVGYCAVSHQFDLGALIFFLMMLFWQMPHFFSIAIYRLKDYTAASIPVLPVIKGLQRTKHHMVVYILGFIGTTLLFTLFKYTGYLYLTVTTLLGIAWLILCLRGYKSGDDQLWARQMFRLSLIIITALSILIPFDII